MQTITQAGLAADLADHLAAVTANDRPLLVQDGDEENDVVLMSERVYRRLEQEADRLTTIADPDWHPHPSSEPTVRVSEASLRSRMAEVLHQVTQNVDVLVERRSGPGVVIMSERGYRGFHTTIELLTDPVGARELLKSMGRLGRTQRDAPVAAE